MAPAAPVRLPLGPLMADVAGTALDAEECAFLRRPAVGAVILFSRNYESPGQVSDLVREIRSLRTPPLLVAVDQEGGRVQRFREGFRPLPPLFALGTAYRDDPVRARRLAEGAGRLMAAELRRTGVDFSFAPVLDLADLGSRVIGDRAFHQDAAVVTDLARAYVQGMAGAGMRATGKHFPGHGGVRADSHMETPVDPRPLEDLWQSDLVPFRLLSPLLGGIMTAHVRFPGVDSRLPSYSDRWIREILRDRIGFGGAVFSDDLTMRGAADAGSTVERARLALAAGCDMVLVCNDPAAARAVADSLGPAETGQGAALERMAGAPCGADEGELAALSDEVQPLFGAA